MNALPQPRGLKWLGASYCIFDDSISRHQRSYRNLSCSADSPTRDGGPASCAAAAWLSGGKAHNGHPSSLMAHPEVMQAIPVKPRKRLSQPKVASQLYWRNDGAVTEAEVYVAPAAPQCVRRLEWIVTVLLRSGKSSHCFANVGHMREAHQQNAHFAQQRSPLSSHSRHL